jgi:LAO/AO transport system kinase
VIRTSSTTGVGIDDLIGAVQQHRDWATESGEGARRNADAMKSEIEALLRDRVLRDLANRVDQQSLDTIVSRVVDKRLDPYSAVDELLGRATCEKARNR